MKLISVVSSVKSISLRNKLFELSSIKIGADLLLPFVELRAAVTREGFQIATYDYCAERFDLLIFIDRPYRDHGNVESLLNKNVPKYLILLESDSINPAAYDEIYINKFDIVFTWSDGLLQKFPEKCIKINFSHRFGDARYKAARRKKVVAVYSNKRSNKKGELYSARLGLIKYLEKQDFIDLYGNRWNKRTFRNSYVEKLSSLYPPLFNIGYRPLHSFKGEASDKIEILSRYVFSLAFENFSGKYGYITEKIFDSFKAGSIPIYLGAPNVADYIPENCFIDYRKFNNPECLYDYISNLDDSTISDFQDEIYNFLHSELSYTFTTDCFVDTIVKELRNDLA
jgi:hypothetical protein